MRKNQFLSSGPAATLAAVTPDDDADLPDGVAMGLWVGGVGDVVLHDGNGNGPLTIKAVPAGTLLPVMVSRVTEATTATELVALY